MDYVSRVLSVAKGQRLRPGEEKELKTLATGLDLLTAGDLPKLGHLLMQRFKAVEAVTREVPLEVAEHYELLPSESLGASSQREQEVAGKACLREKRIRNLWRVGRSG